MCCMGKKLTVDSTDVFEWYDGIVLGIGYFGEITALVCLLAFNPDAHKRAYILAFISKEKAAKYKTLLEVSGFAALNRKALSEAIINNPKIYLTRDEPLRRTTISLAELTPDQRDRLPSFYVPLLDRAVKPKRISEWIG
jgi:hypothetical protein